LISGINHEDLEDHEINTGTRRSRRLATQRSPGSRRRNLAAAATGRRASRGPDGARRRSQAPSISPGFVIALSRRPMPARQAGTTVAALRSRRSPRL